jgi:anti-sigma regulatory factor (Ser/Thr protein kinase)
MMHCRSDQFPDGNDFQNEQLILRLDKDIPSDPKILDDAVKEITAALDRRACWEDIETSGLAVHAALANAIIHGNQSDLKKVVRISVTVNENCDLLVSVRDFGAGFDPSELANPTMDEVDFPPCQQ